VFLQFENKKDVLDYMDGFRKEASSGTNCLPYRRWNGLDWGNPC